MMVGHLFTLPVRRPSCRCSLLCDDLLLFKNWLPVQAADLFDCC